MNVYDCAHNLATAIKESEEFKQYDAARAKVDANPDISNMIKDFEQKSVELQMKQMQGEEVGPDQMAGIQQLYGIVLQDPLAAEYLQTSMRFSIMMKDVYEIIGEATGVKGMF